MPFNNEERIGVYSVAKIFVEDFKWIFREQPINDFGFDALIEITKIIKPLKKEIVPTGHIFGIQIKSGNSFFKESDSKKFIFRGSKRQLNYWKNHSFPIIIILYDKNSNTAYWQKIDNTTVINTQKAFKINIPKSNILDIECREQKEKFGYFKNQYEYKLWRLKKSTDLIDTITKYKHFLYIEISECNLTTNYQVSILITKEDDEYITKIFNCSSEHFYTFYLSENKSLVEGINDTIPWVDLFQNGVPFTDEIFSKNVITDIEEFTSAWKISPNFLKNNYLYNIPFDMIGEYYFKLEAKPNKLAFNFLSLNHFLKKESDVEQRFFI